VNIKFNNEDTPKFDLDLQLTQSYLIDLIEKEEKMAGEITVVFCSDEYLLQLNKEFLDHDYFTDIITFDYCDNNIISGDIFVSIDRIHYNAKKYNVGFNIELHRVLFHGVLHLIGYNDKTSGEKKEMRSKEDYYLNEFLKN